MLHDNELISKNIHVLKQAIELIERLDDFLFVNTIPPYLKSSAGSHFRHCIDFYNSLLAGIETGRINYDLRERNECVATRRAVAIAQIGSIIERLAKLYTAEMDSEIEVLLEGSSGGIEPSSWSRSSVNRELQFLLSHTVHHYALIAFTLRLQGFEPGEDFGVAPSTLQHWRGAALCAK
jgi:hypothetical protein